MGNADGGGNVTIIRGNGALDGTAQAVAGSLQVSFGDGSYVGPSYKGSFSVPYCPTLNQ